jgi:hypothetical protein
MNFVTGIKYEVVKYKKTMSFMPVFFWMSENLIRGYLRRAVIVN